MIFINVICKMCLKQFSCFLYNVNVFPKNYTSSFIYLLRNDFVKFNCRKNYSDMTWKKKVKKSTEKHDKINDEKLQYTLIEPFSSQLTQLLVAAKSKKNRYAKQIILVEGKRLIKEALKAKIQPVMILFSRKHLIEDLPLDPHYTSAETTILRKLKYSHIKLWSDLTTSPGIFGIFKMPNLEKNQRIIDPLPITMVCDNIREPGNLGSILRVAAAIPVQKVILLAGCTDLWDSKVIRGSSGALFYLTIQSNASWEDVKDTCHDNVIIADHIPASSSKNGIIPVEMYNNSNEIEESVVHSDDENNEIKFEKDIREIYQLPVISCYDFKCRKDQSYVIIIGGETCGLSEECFEFAASRNGYRVYIPLSECVNNLNSATALGIISFEIKRQLLSSS